MGFSGDRPVFLAGHGLVRQPSTSPSADAQADGSTGPAPPGLGAARRFLSFGAAPRGVFVRAALPGWVRVDEVDGQAGVDAQLGVLAISAPWCRLAPEQVHVISQRFGHSSPVVTMTIHAHVLPGNKREAANTLGLGKLASVA
jgi:hypothetical protein